MAERLRQKITELKIRLDQAEARSECFKESLHEVDKRIDCAEATAAALRQQATLTEVEIKRISSRLENIEGQLWSTGETLKRNERAMDNLANEEVQMNAKQNTLHEKLKTVKDSVTINESKLSEASRRIKVVELQKKLAEKRCQRLSELEGQLHARLSEVNKTVEELQSSPRQGMSEEEEQALNEKIEDLKNSYIESEAKAELAQRKIAALSYKRNELQNELQEITEKKQWVKDELKRVYNDIGL
ncbi:tropomyosin-like [Pocillopora verrucosa]|uniref:tropomyosin-like n=1 Tax=Pocillopora verrucosa TaxID=203993 RepID=UPI002796F7B5|nr:tropomyosin-like [Pocillopora verrucosa]